MAVSSPRNGRRGDPNRRRRAAAISPVPGSRAPECAVGGCRDASTSTCPRCQRLICSRHAGVVRTQGHGHARPAGKSPGRAGNVARCAQCRLEERRRGQTSIRRIWWAISAAGFAVLIGVAMKSNLRLGVELLALAIVLLLVAYFYDRSLRRP